MNLDRTPFIILASDFEREEIRKRAKINNIYLKYLLAPLRFELDNGCWFRVDDWSIYTTVKKIAAHRLSFHLFTGLEPIQGLEICHKCDRKGCINPDHLFQGTHSANMRDAINKDRVFSIRIR